MSEERPKRVHGRWFLKALADAGIIDEKDYIRRVIIDASVDSAIHLYVERYGDERLLDVAAARGGYVIRARPPEDPGADDPDEYYPGEDNPPPDDPEGDEG